MNHLSRPSFSSNCDDRSRTRPVERRSPRKFLLTGVNMALLAAAGVAQQPPLFRTADPSVAGAAHGASLTGIGDINGNGWNDFVVGEPGDAGAAPLFPARGGSVWIYDGMPTGNATCPCGPNVGFCVPNGGAAAPINTLYGALVNDKLGAQVLGVDDIDGDGVRELLVTRGEGNQVGGVVRNGAVLLYSGSSLLGGVPAPLATIAMPPHAASFSLQSQWFGQHLQSIGDWNGDGIAEVLIGAPMAHDTTVVPAQQKRGMFEVHDLVAAAAGVPSRLVRVFGTVTDGRFGTASIGLDDLTGDGIPEFAVSTPSEIHGPLNGTGSVHVFAGGRGTPLVKISVPGSSGNLLGSSLAAFDRNGDGKRDLAVGEPGYASGFSKVRIFDGAQLANGVVTQSTEWQPGLTVVAALTNTQLWDSFGASQANMGDLDGDGVDDILVGTWSGSNFDPDNLNGLFPFLAHLNNSGAAYLMSGATGNVLKIYSEACSSGDSVGYAVANLGDLDQDGINDLGIGAPASAYNGVAGSGVVRCYPGAYEIGVPYGTATPNSTGLAATIAATGSSSLADNTLRLIARNVPGGRGGQFLVSDTASTGTPFFQGLLWIQSPLRLSPLTAIPGSGPQQVTYQVDMTLPPAAALALQGTFLYFQYWFSEPTGGRNLTNAVRIGILP